MHIPTELRYLESHEWCRVEDGIAVVGITDFAQDQLGDVVYIELPEVGTVIEDRGEPFGVIESVKAASDLYSPVTGEVVAINSGLEDSLEVINEDPYGAGWMVKIQMVETGEINDLLDSDAYAVLIADEP